jgi:hypothetical protein
MGLETRRRSSRSAASLPRARRGTAAALLATAGAGSAHASESQYGLALDVAVLAGSTPASMSYDGYTGGSSFSVSFSSSEPQFGLMLPGVSAGAWLSSQVTLAARITNIWYVPDVGKIVNGYAGLELGYAPSERWLLAAGIGTQLDGELDAPDFGVGADLRIAYLPFQLHPSALGFTAELIAGYVDDWFAYSAGAGLLWRL